MNFTIRNTKIKSNTLAEYLAQYLTFLNIKEIHFHGSRIANKPKYNDDIDVFILTTNLTDPLHIELNYFKYTIDIIANNHKPTWLKHTTNSLLPSHLRDTSLAPGFLNDLPNSPK